MAKINYRLKEIEIFTETFLCFMKDSKSQKYAECLEKSCYIYSIELCKISIPPINRSFDCIQFCKVYANKCTMINMMLKFPPLIQKILNKQIKITNIVNMSDYELCPEFYKKYQDENELRSTQKIIEKSSCMFTCPACKKSEITYREVITRCLDEATTFYCTCVLCKHEFQR